VITDLEHVQALRQRLINTLREEEQAWENRRAELQHMINVLGNAPDLLKRVGIESPSLGAAEREPGQPTTRYNLTFSKDVAEYVAAFPFDEVIRIKPMLETLKREKGLKGKDKSLYAYASQILSRMVEKNEHYLKHQDGVGYFKSRKDEETLVGMDPDGSLTKSEEGSGS